MTLEKAATVQTVEVGEFRYNLIGLLLEMEADIARREMEEK